MRKGLNTKTLSFKEESAKFTYDNKGRIFKQITENF